MPRTVGVVVVSGLMIHVYTGVVFPEEKPAFFSMITGTVPELFAAGMMARVPHGAAPRRSSTP